MKIKLDKCSDSLIANILNYLLYIAKYIDSDEFSLEIEKESLINVFVFLKEYNCKDTIELLKVKIKK